MVEAVAVVHVQPLAGEGSSGGACYCCSRGGRKLEACALSRRSPERDYPCVERRTRELVLRRRATVVTAEDRGAFAEKSIRLCLPQDGLAVLGLRMLVFSNDRLYLGLWNMTQRPQLLVQPIRLAE